MIALLDVNVVVALFDPSHVHHDAAHAWFERNRSRRWATCALTDNAVIRVISNPAYSGRLTTVEDAASRLRTFCSDREHVFWTDSISILDTHRFHWQQVQGHRQITDIYLLALSTSNRGRLATFDSGISIKAVAGATASNLVVI